MGLVRHSDVANPRAVLRPARSLVPRQRLQGMCRSLVAAGAACDRLRSSRQDLETVEGPVAAATTGQMYDLLGLLPGDAQDGIYRVRTAHQ